MPYKLEVDLAAVNGGMDYAVTTGKKDSFPYADGKNPIHPMA